MLWEENHFFKKIRKISKEEEEMLFDPQTSVGLLLSIPSQKADIEAAALIGEVVGSDQPSVLKSLSRVREYRT